MNIIVLQHIKIEDPGYIKDLMLADGVKLTTIELDEGEKIPNNLNQFDGMFCMGGPMDTYMEKEYPWLIEEKKRIKEFVVDLKKPYLGFCLGCQLLGEVVGGQVVKSSPAEIGMMNINFTKEKNQDNLFNKIFNNQQILKNGGWHFTRVISPEEIHAKELDAEHHDEYRASNKNPERIRDLINRRMIDHDHLADSRENKYGKEFALKQLTLDKMPLYIKDNTDKYKEFLDLD